MYFGHADMPVLWPLAKADGSYSDIDQARMEKTLASLIGLTLG